MSSIPFYLITNVGTLIRSETAVKYPFHLFLAQVIKEAPQVYRSVIQRMRQDTPRDIILDNGAYENAMCTWEELDAQIELIQPDCVVLPDYPEKEWELTRDIAMEFYERMYQRGYWDFVKRIMIVPQGKTKEDALRGYRWGVEAAMIENRVRSTCKKKVPSWTVGIGRAYLHWVEAPVEVNRQWEKGRQDMMGDIIQACMGVGSQALPPFHILGGRKFPTPYWKKLAIAGLNIVGLDAYEPCRCALGGECFPVVPKYTPHGSLEPVSDNLLHRNIESYAAAYGLTTSPVDLNP